MIRRLSLSQRLTLVFTFLLLLCAVAACGVQLYSSAQYGNAMVQRLSASLARQIVASEQLLDQQGAVNRQTLKLLFDRLMVLNPSVELYLLSPGGELLADVLPPENLKRKYIDTAPLQTFLSGEKWPVYGDDPRSLDKRKVFSVAPVLLEGRLRGYLYIILQGDYLNALAERAWKNALQNAVLWALLLVIVQGGLAGGLVYYWVTRPIKQLTRQVSGLEQDSIGAIKSLAAQIPDERGVSEMAVLQKTFIELARKIAGQWDQLADSDRQRREFVANISHDLRTPLTSLLGYLETLSLKAERLTAEESKHYLNIALQHGFKVRHLSQQLFELARLEYGDIRPQPESFSLAELVQDVAQKFDLIIETRGLCLQMGLPRGLPQVYADLSMMERVLTNLLDNAVRHVPKGGLISVRACQQGQQIMIDVEDNGPGIPPALRATLFQRPLVLKEGKSGELSGGLGLMIVQRMLQLHGGDITLLDTGTGSCFRFSLPLRSCLA